MTPGCQKIGHGGASALAPANTLESFETALELGIDMIEFDVRAWNGELILAHTPLDARRGGCLTLPSALDHFTQPRYRGIELNLDVKHTGTEAAVLAALEHRGLTGRCLASSQVPEVLDRFRRRHPGLAVGISVGGRLARIGRRWRDWRLAVLEGIATGRWDALMAHHGLIDPALVADVGARDGRLYAWTVNDRARIGALRGLGVDGITTADPRLFAG